jgi:hypothetical protein
MNTNKSLFLSSDHIKSFLVCDPSDYPTIQHMDSFNHYLDSWQFYKGKLDQYDLFCSEIKCHLDTEIPENPEESYGTPIRPFLDMLPQFDYIFEIEKIVDITEKAWNVVDDKKIFVLKNKPQWIYENKIGECENLELRLVLQEWVTAMDKSRYNLFPMYETLGKFAACGVNYSSIMDLINKQIEQFQQSFKYIEERLNDLIKTINRSTSFELRIRNGTTITEIASEVANGDCTFFEDELSQMCMKSMMKAITETTGAKEWFISDGNISSKSPVLSQLSNHSDVQKCGHTGCSMSWTLAQFRNIYTNGWLNYITQHLLSRGVGWDQIDFTKALEYKNEECCLYHAKKMVDVWTSLIPLRDVIDKIIEFEWKELGSYILEKYGNMFSKHDYRQWTLYCDKNLKNGVYYLFNKMWNHYYPRSVSIADIHYTNLIRAMWKELAKKEYISDSLPTDEEIYKETDGGSITFLKGVFMCGFKQDDTYDPYWFDKTVGSFGKFESLIKELQ